MSTKTYFITGGPSKELLVDSFKSTYGIHERVAVAFYVRNEKNEKVFLNIDRITSLEYRDEIGYSFNISGITKDSQKFSGYYSTNTKDGHIRIS